jgi:hypothetical protein
MARSLPAYPLRHERLRSPPRIVIGSSRFSLLAGCEQKGPAEKAGEKMDKAVDKAVDDVRRLAALRNSVV